VNAFWELPITICRQFAQYYGVEFQPATPLGDLLWLLIFAITAKSDEEILKFITRRWALMSEGVCTGVLDVVLEMDGDCEFLDRQEREGLKKQRTKRASRRDDMKDFKSFLKRKRDSGRAEWLARVRGFAKGKGKGKAKGKDKGKEPEGPPQPWENGPQKRKSPDPPLPPGTIEQRIAKGLLPPGASIWCAFSVGAWAVHLPPYKRHYAPWDHSGGSNEACVLAIQHVWDLYLAEHGLERADCPIDGLYDATRLNEDGILENPPAAAAAPAPKKRRGRG
jgi:hypothetical protein